MGEIDGSGTRQRVVNPPHAPDGMLEDRAMPGCAAKTGVVAFAVLLLAATASRREAARPDAADSAAMQLRQSCC